MLTVKLVYKLSDVPDDLELVYKHTYDTIYTHFQGMFTRPPYFCPSIFDCIRPNDGWMGLYIKLCTLESGMSLFKVTLDDNKQSTNS